MFSSGNIRYVTFGLRGDNDNTKSSCVTITNSKLNNIDGTPADDGVQSRQQGTTAYEYKCLTCKNGKDKCPGHNGLISMRYPLQSPICYPEIIQLLNAVCHSCSELIIKKDKNIESLPNSKKLPEYAKLVKNNKNRICVHCAYTNPITSRDKFKDASIVTEFVDGKFSTKTVLYNHEIVDIFHKISPSSLKKLGMSIDNGPSKFIISEVIAIPPHARPEIRQMGGGRSKNNDQTQLIKALVELNTKLPEIIPGSITMELGNLYTTIDTIYHDMIRGVSTSSMKLKITSSNNKPLQSLMDRMADKTGRVRGTLMGTTSKFSGRAVIVGDSELNVNYVHFPKTMARLLQVPEVVNVENRYRLQTYVNNGPDVYPGCKRVIKKKGAYRPGIVSITLEVGDVVERDLVDDDPILLNRAPTMFIHGISSHFIKIWDENSIGLSTVACALYAADFDGDAMHVYVPTSESTRNEIESHCMPGSHFTSRQRESAMLGCTQDTLPMVSGLTRGSKLISKYDTMQLFKNIPNDIKFTKDEYTGREILSMILPNVNYNNKAKFYNPGFANILDYKPGDINVIIEKGELVSGVLDSVTIGIGSNTILHNIHNEMGAEAAIGMMHKLTQIGVERTYQESCSISIDDIIINKSLKSVLDEKLSDIITTSMTNTKELYGGRIVAPMGMSVMQFYEHQQLESLTLGDTFTETILESVKDNKNRLWYLIECGIGKYPNFNAIFAAIGQDLVEGKRPPVANGRTSPYFHKWDPSPIANGFIANSYTEGVSPVSLLFSAISGRHAAVNRALTTALGGSQQREHNKNMESCITNNYRQVAKESKIVQLLYSSHGIDTKYMEKNEIPTVMMSDKRFEELYRTSASNFKSHDSKSLQTILDTEFKHLSDDRLEYRKLFFVTETIYVETPFSDKFKAPFNVDRIIRNMKSNHPASEVLDPIKFINTIDKFCNELPYIYSNEGQKRNKGLIPLHHYNALRVFVILIRSHLNTSNMIRKKLSNNIVDLVLIKITSLIKKSLIDPGTVIGIQAAQNFTEPITQRIISSHHRSGLVGDINAVQTNALTKLDEVMNARNTSEMQNPSMTLRLLPEYEGDKKYADDIVTAIKVLKFNTLLSSRQIFFEDYKNTIHPEFIGDNKIVKKFEEHNPGTVVPSDLSNWVIRYELNITHILSNNITLLDIITKLYTAFPKLFIVYTPDNHTSLIIRCYIRNSHFTKVRSVQLKDIISLSNDINDTIVRGSNSIKYAYVSTEFRSFVTDTGEVEKKKTFVVKTGGSDLQNVLLRHSILDSTRSYTDSILEMYDIYGIEAARVMFRMQMDLIVDGLSQSIYKLYADELTRTGELTSISLAGLKAREPDNILLHTVYRDTKRQFITAALNGKKTSVSGCSGPLMLGKMPNIGTTYNSVILNNEFINNNTMDVMDIMDIF